MPRKHHYWTRKLELDLVEFVRNREFIWKPVGNTNHHIQQKYKAYAEFASKLGRGFTARSVRDRWVNIRSTFNHNLRRIDKSRETAKTAMDIYVPCWPLWKPLQFLRDISRRDDVSEEGSISPEPDSKATLSDIQMKEELQPELTDSELLLIRQRSQRTDRPRRKTTQTNIADTPKQCTRFLDDLLQAMAPLSSHANSTQQYWFFGRHVTERLNAMTDVDAECAARDIMAVLNSCSDMPQVKLEGNYEHKVDPL